MRGVKLQVKGYEQLKKQLKNIPAHIVTEVDAELDAVSEDFVNRAVGDAPTDQRLLRNQITKKKVGPMRYEVVSGAEHSAFVEFGTRSKTQVPSGLQTYAAQFKGIKGRGDAKAIIYEWCRRNSVPEEAWFPIFIKIMTVGINPHPFFFKQMSQAEKQIEQGAAQAVQRALRK